MIQVELGVEPRVVEYLYRFVSEEVARYLSKNTKYFIVPLSIEEVAQAAVSEEDLSDLGSRTITDAVRFEYGQPSTSRYTGTCLRVRHRSSEETLPVWARPDGTLVLGGIQ